MAYRRPLKLDGGNLRSMSSAEVNLIVDEVIRLYGNDPSVTMAVDVGNGNLTSITEYRLTAGPRATSSGPTPPADPADYTSVTYDNTYSIGSDATALSNFYTSEFGGTFPIAFVISKLPSALLSVNFKPSAEPSLSILNKSTPFLSLTCKIPADTVLMVSLFEP